MDEISSQSMDETSFRSPNSTIRLNLDVDFSLTSEKFSEVQLKKKIL